MYKFENVIQDYFLKFIELPKNISYLHFQKKKIEDKMLNKITIKEKN